MKISIVTINYNGSENTINLLKSLEDQTDKNFQIIVADNASEEADFARLQEIIHIPTSQVGYPQLVRNSENFGFSGGNNVGIRQALENGSKWVVLLNNDAWVESDFIERLGPILSTRRGIIGIPILEGGPAPNLSADRHSPVGEKGRIWCGAGRTAYCGKIQWLKPTLIHITSPNDVYPQIYAIGGAVAIRKDVFDKIGLLDEKYFLYFEDADFSVRARKAGFDISRAPDNCMVYHTVSASTKKLGSPLLLRYHYRNALYFNLKNGPWYIKLAVWPWSWVISIKQFIKIAIKQNTEESKAILNGVLDFYKNKMGKIK